ncbi:MAG: hypothetical protein DMD79_27185 [Candidatus Rokuibacteriota bacterium]|nr:MAG: hypothetical protein DMD79_27185 [Candidatus Rokubacteria bacterium]
MRLAWILAVLLTLGRLAAPLVVEGQQARLTRVGWLLPDPKPFALDPFRQRLKELGWIEGGNLVIEQRYSHGVAERYAPLVTELVRLKVAALVTDGQAATRAAQRTTPTIPILFVSGNPVAQGFVTSLSHPGKNLTGVAILTGSFSRRPLRAWLVSPSSRISPPRPAMLACPGTGGPSRRRHASWASGWGRRSRFVSPKNWTAHSPLPSRREPAACWSWPLRSSPHKARGS